MKDLGIIGASAETQNIYVSSTVKFVKAARMSEQRQSSRHFTCCRARNRRPRSDWNLTVQI